MPYRRNNKNTKRILTYIILFVLFIILASSVTFVGCRRGGVYTVYDANINNTWNSMAMSYSSFKGDKYTKIPLEAGDKLSINISTTTSSGYLNIYIIKGIWTKIYRVESTKQNISTTSQQTITTTINIAESGTYKIKVKGNHSGSYNIQWNVLNTN